MGDPVGLSDAMAAIVLLTSAYCFSRLLVARRWHRSMHYDVNLAHVAMGVAMAGMFLASFRTLPVRLWETIFGCLTVWFAWQIGRFLRRFGLSRWNDDQQHHVSHYATHLVMTFAMLYMFLVFGAVPFSSPSGSAALATSSAHAGSMSAAGGVRPSLPLLLLVVLLASAVWHADGLSRFSKERRRRPTTVAAGEGGRPSPVALPRSPLRAPAMVIDAAPESRRARMLAVRRSGTSELRRAPVLSCHDRRWLAPRLEIACHIAMCVTMAYMLVTLR